MAEPFRLEPAMPAGSYKSYRITQPKTGHTRIGSCQSAGCEAYEYGWRTTVPLLSTQAGYIRNSSGRKFREDPGENGLTTFTFYPGQQCFTEHHVTDRPQFYAVRDGDWRGNPTGAGRRHVNGQDWVEDFAEHQDRLKTQIERG